MPGFLAGAAESLSKITAPLSMMVIGSSLVEFRLRDLFTDVRLLIFSTAKLPAVPVLGIWVIMRLVSDPVICGVCMAMLATPVGSMTAMLAQQYDGNYGLASKGAALTTILSVITMPLVAAVAGL